MLYGVLRHCLRSYFILLIGGLAPSQGAVADTARAIESGCGAIQYVLYDLAKYFPTRIGQIAKGEGLAQISGSTIVLKGLAPGFYAVAVFYDENYNDDFDQGIFGIPLEDYGFSNNARGFFSAPDFDDSKFRVRVKTTVISIELGR